MHLTYSPKVLDFATKAHAGQFRKYGSNLPYITHPIAVANIAVNAFMQNQGKLGLLGLNGELSKNFSYAPDYIYSVGYLHDVLEDTSVLEDELNDFLVNLTPEYAASILKDVKLLTKTRDNFDLFVYLNNLKKQGLFARLVKLADLEHNMSDLKVQKKIDYYRLVKYYLEN